MTPLSLTLPHLQEGIHGQEEEDHQRMEQDQPLAPGLGDADLGPPQAVRLLPVRSRALPTPARPRLQPLRGEGRALARRLLLRLRRVRRRR